MVDLESSTATSVERRLLATVRAALLIVALTVQFATSGPRFFTEPLVHPAEGVVYLVLAATGVGCAVVMLVAGNAPALVRWFGVAVLLACSVTMSAVLPLDAVQRAEHWSLSLVGWYALALLFDVSLWRIAAFLLIHSTVLVWPMVAGGATPRELAAMAVSMVATVGFQFGVAAGAVLVRSIASSATETARAEERLRGQEEAAAAVARNRARRYADLRLTTIPLLAGFAVGDLDPRDPVVRRACAVEAARMRRLFSENEDVADPLLHELGAVIDVAERHGVSAHVSVRGTPGEVPEPVRRKLLAPISEALVMARSEARVTVLHSQDQVRVSVRCVAPAVPVTRPDGIDVSESVSNGQLWLETSWRSR